MDHHDLPGAPDCPLCQGIGYVRSNIADIRHENFGKLLPCSCRSKELAERTAKKSGMRTHEMQRRLDDIVPLAERVDVERLRTLDIPDLIQLDSTAGMVEVCRRFIEKPWGWLTVWGPYGNAKTHVLQAVVNEFREEYQLIGAYITLAELFAVVRAGFDKDADEPAALRLDRFCTLPLLAVDEIDAAQMTAWGEETRRRIFDSRYRDGVMGDRFTLLAMNCQPSALPGDLYDRVRDGRFVVYHNKDKSVRPAMGPWGEGGA